MVFLSHEQVAIIAISCVLVIFYIAALSDGEFCLLHAAPVIGSKRSLC